VVPARVAETDRVPTMARGNLADFEDRLTRARDPGRPLFTQSMTPLPPPIAPSDSGEQDAAPPDAMSATAPSLPALDPQAAPTRSQRHKVFEEVTSVESPSEALLIASSKDTSDELEAEFQRVFDEFVATRQKCGEGLEGVTLDKFVDKLRNNRAQLIQRYGCASVRFQVYIKDGKTALKATPVT
jgi:hypothetical protein